MAIHPSLTCGRAADFDKPPSLNVSALVVSDTSPAARAVDDWNR
jgi:hypothetical protein